MTNTFTSFHSPSREKHGGGEVVQKERTGGMVNIL